MLQVTVSPFSHVGPGQSSVGQVGFTSPANASYTASIAADAHSIFKVIKISAARPTVEYVSSGGGAGDGVKGPPPKPVKVVVDVPVGSSNGVTPLNVLKGDQLQITVQMVCPNNPDDTYAATLTIVSSNSADSTAVPLMVATGEMDVQVVNDTAVAAPGSTATWLLKVTSVAGAGANISFAAEYPPASVGIPPITSYVKRRGQEMLTVTASVGETAAPGTYKFFLAETVFNDIFSPFSLSLTVTNPVISLTSTQPSTFEIIPGTQIQFALHLQLQGAGTVVDLQISLLLSSGLTCTFLDAQNNPIPSWQLDLTTKEGMDLPVQLMADQSATSGAASLSFFWIAYNGTEKGTLDFGIVVLPQAIAFSSGTANAKNLIGSVTGSVQWTLNAQGFWNFTGNVQEGDVIGQSYSFGAALNVQDASGNAIAVVHSGSLGPNLPAGHNTDNWSDEGFDQRIIDLWPAITSAQASYELVATTDVLHAAEAVVEALAVVYAAVLVGASAVEGLKGFACDAVPKVQLTGGDGGVGIDVVWTCTK